MIDRPKEWWTQVEAKESTSLENRKCPFCGKEMICVNTQDGEFTCTTCAEYANHDVLDFIEKLKAENERLKGELKQMEVQDQVVIDTLRNENERLKGENEKIEAESQKAFDVLTESVKAVCKEYEKMKCLALHAISKYCFSQGTIIHTKLELTEQPIEEDRKMIHKVNIRDRWGDFFYKAYRKAKKTLREGKC